MEATSNVGGGAGVWAEAAKAARVHRNVSVRSDIIFLRKC
jgi:hypothetical protein